MAEGVRCVERGEEEQVSGGNVGVGRLRGGDDRVREVCRQDRCR